jgi:hypothetical protein
MSYYYFLFPWFCHCALAFPSLEVVKEHIATMAWQSTRGAQAIDYCDLSNIASTVVTTHNSVQVESLSLYRCQWGNRSLR